VAHWEILVKVKRTNLTREQYIERLLKHGWKQAGNGSFATVFKKGKKVIKVTRLDLAYAAYARKVMRWGKSKWFPKIYAARRYLCVPLLRDGAERIHAEYSVYVMEKLVQLTKKEQSNYYVGILRRIIDNKENIVIPDLRMRRVLRMLNKHYNFDLHHQNVMRRESGHLVISDPIFSWRMRLDRSVRL
jgi:hypothetical protein